MVLKRKKDCKLILDNSNYYVEGCGYFFKFNNLEDAQYFYNNFKKLYLNSRQLYEIEGKIVLDLYPSDVELILKGVEQIKFFIDNSIYKNCIPKEEQKI